MRKGDYTRSLKHYDGSAVQSKEKIAELIRKNRWHYKWRSEYMRLARHWPFLGVPENEPAHDAPIHKSMWQTKLRLLIRLKPIPKLLKKLVSFGNNIFSL